MTQPRQLLPLSQRGVPPLSFDIQSGLFSTIEQDTIHAIFAPIHYEPGYSYPLVVWLHGPGGDERQLLRIMPLVSMRNYVAVAPRGVIIASREGVIAPREGVIAPREGGISSAAEKTTYGWSHAEQDLQQAEQRIFDSIEIAFHRYNIHSRRIFLAGFDTGGTMALRVAMNHPYKFAGVLSLGGCMPTGGAPLSRLPEARQLAVFLAAGRRSAIYDEQQVCGDLRLLHTAGMSITLRLYGCGHEIAPQMLSDVDHWIIEQVEAGKAQASA